LTTKETFEHLEEALSRPRPFEFYTADDLWTDEHISQQMLKYHLNPDVDLSSRRHDFIDRSAAWIATRFGIGLGSGVADFGCGPGLYTSRLAATGASVTGIDFSENSLAYARDQAAKAGHKIDYVCRNYLDYRSEKRYDLIEMIMCDFCALSPQQRQDLLGIFAGHLKPGGYILFDAYTLNAFERREESTSFGKNSMNGFWSAEDYICLSQTFKYDAEKVVLDKYTVIQETGTKTIYNWLQYFDPNEIGKEFERAGLKVETLLGDVAGSPFDPDADEFAVVARRI